MFKMRMFKILTVCKLFVHSFAIVRWLPVVVVSLWLVLLYNANLVQNKFETLYIYFPDPINIKTWENIGFNLKISILNTILILMLSNLGSASVFLAWSIATAKTTKQTCFENEKKKTFT